jgi:DNA-binding MarR family transcriptional regulator
VNNLPPAPSSGYWYGRDAARREAVRVLQALRDYRAAEAAMRRRTKDSMGMGETDLLALRYLLEAQRTGKPLGPRDLAARLGISSASTTTLLDRLTKSGHVRREPHPTDRRALIITATDDSDHEVRATLGAMHQRMLEAAESLTPEQAETVVGFLNAVRDAVDGIGTGHGSTAGPA